MAEFQAIFRESQRMCSTYRICTDGCLLYDDENCICMYRALAESGAQTAKEIERIVMDWVEAHKEPVYPSWRDAMKYIFPDAGDVTCPEQWFGEECPNDMSCNKCTCRPMSKKVAEKLGIKPVGGGDDV